MKNIKFKARNMMIVINVKTYFLKEREEELGHLASSFLLDFIFEN